MPVTNGISSFQREDVNSRVFPCDKQGEIEMNNAITVHRRKRWFIRELPLHLMLLPAVVCTFIFHYLPMFGIVMAFQKFNPMLSFSGSKWVKWDNFRYVFRLSNFGTALTNSFEIAIVKVILDLIVPLIIALMLNEVRSNWFKRVSQTVYFLPFFLSWVVLGGVFRELFGLDGAVNTIISAITGKKIFFLANGRWMRTILYVTNIWKDQGYHMIIYLAAITNVDSGLYEAAAIDGCGRVGQCWHVTLPCIRPMIILLSTLSIGSIMSAGFDQIFNLYNPLVYDSVDIIDTFVYRLGLQQRQYSVSAALGLFKSTVSLVLVGLSYYSAYKLSDYRIF